MRIWTPNVGEVPFAGHPVLGTAYVIREMLESGSEDTVYLNLKAGQISVYTSEYGQTMVQNAPEFGAVIDKKEIAEIYGISEGDIMDEYPVQWVSTGLEAVIVPLKNREILSKIQCSRERFLDYVRRYPSCYCNHLFFTETGDCELAARCLMEDFVEDPATGSANGCLGAYLVKHRYFGKDCADFTVYQGEDMGRPSVLHIRASADDDVWTIEAGGSCCIVAAGEWA